MAVEGPAPEVINVGLEQYSTHANVLATEMAVAVVTLQAGDAQRARQHDCMRPGSSGLADCLHLCLVKSKSDKRETKMMFALFSQSWQLYLHVCRVPCVTLGWWQEGVGTSNTRCNQDAGRLNSRHWTAEKNVLLRNAHASESPWTPGKQVVWISKGRPQGGWLASDLAMQGTATRQPLSTIRMQMHGMSVTALCSPQGCDTGRRACSCLLSL